MDNSSDSGLKVLVIEDSRDCADLLRHKLKQLRIISDIKVLGSGEEGLEFLKGECVKDKNNSFLPDLFFMDIHLPGESGLETLVKIKSNPLFYSTPVIVLTASENKQDIPESYKKGGTIFMRKPLEETFLEDVLTYMKITGRFKSNDRAA